MKRHPIIEGVIADIEGLDFADDEKRQDAEEGIICTVQTLIDRLATADATISASQEEITRLRKALEWQPIATAPRDGTRFLAAEPEDGWIIGICVWCKTPHVPIYGFHFTDGDPEDWDMCNPKFWRLLPTHPHEGDSA